MKGLWKENIDIPNRESGVYQEMSETHTVKCTEIVSCSEFYLQGVANKQLSLISDKLAKLNSNNLQAFVFPAKKGSPCLAKFDGGLYRA